MADVAKEIVQANGFSNGDYIPFISQDNVKVPSNSFAISVLSVVQS